MRHEADPGDHEREQQELPAPGEAERAPPRQLQVVVDEADRRARERRPGDGQSRPGVLGEDDEGKQRARQQADASHRGRALLGLMPRRPVLADVLAELVAAQERDEGGPGHDPEQHRDHAGGQHQLHVSASTTVSRPGRPAGLHEHRVAGAQQVGQPIQRGPGIGVPGAAVAAAERADGHDRGRRRAAAASRPTSACRPGAAGPSSAISPSTATVRRPSAAEIRWRSAARIDTGFAL